MANSALARSRSDHGAPLQRTVLRPPHDGNESAARGYTPRKTARFAHYTARPLSLVAPAVFGIILAAALLAGWLSRDDDYLVPDSGAGYWLGIAGATLMLLLLLYPLRKRMRLGKALGSVALWFRLHMILGLVGPALILFHSNFRLGSLNSNVALAAMLVVATSGIVGRYLYGKIHLGLYGRKVVVRETLADAEALKQSLGHEIPGCDHIAAQMSAFARTAAEMPRGLVGSAWSLPLLALRARVTRRRLRRDAHRFVAAEGKQRGWSRRSRAQRLAIITNLVALHIAAVRKAAAFEFYDRLFGLWHMLHLPLFIVLIFAASIHVVAAHFY
jgi:hypothetical protein